MGDNRDLDYTKKDLADLCESVYKDESLSTKQKTERIRTSIIRLLKDRLNVVPKRMRVGRHFEYHYDIKGINPKLNGVALQAELITRAHSISRNLREWKDAVLALNLPHHLIEKNLAVASKVLAEYIPNFDELMAPGMTANELRDNWKVMYKNERRGKARKAVLAALRDVRFEHHAYYILQPIYVWARQLGTSSDEQNRTVKVKHQIKVNPDYTLETAEKLLKNNVECKIEDADKYELAIAIAIATGRRRTEIFKTAEFEVIGSTPANHLIFSGQLKTKDRALLGDRNPYLIPCLLNVDLVLNGLARLRELQANDFVTYLDQRGNHCEHVPVLGRPWDDQYHNQAVKSYYAHSSNSKIRKIFESPLMEFRYTRDMYSEIGYSRFKQDGEGRSAYRSRVYGHAEGKGDTQRAYEKFELSTEVSTAEVVNPNQEKASSRENAQVIKAMKAKTAEMEKWIRSPNAIKIHRWLIEQLENGLKVDEVTASFIRRHIVLENTAQLNIRTINTYLDEKRLNWEEIKKLVVDVNSDSELDDDSELNDEIDALDVLDSEEDESDDQEIEQNTPKNNKPTLKSSRRGAEWDIQIRHNGFDVVITVPIAQAKTNVEAMTAAWAYFEWGTSLAEMPSVEVSKQGDDHRAVYLNGKLGFECITKGTKTEAKNAVLTMARKARAAFKVPGNIIALNQTIF